MDLLPLPDEMIDKTLEEKRISNFSGASIREAVSLINLLERKSGVEFIRMDMGIPGVPTPEIGLQSEIEALKLGKPAEYAQIDGIPELKREVSIFAKNFLDIDVSPRSCIVTGGSMMGAMICFMVAGKREISRQGVLFIDPGFPVQKKQANVLNLPVFSFDIYEYRGKKLHDKLEDICDKNGISLIVYSNPNNPTWITLTDIELKAIADVAESHNILIVEDLAYFGMDFRQNYWVPGEPPFQPTIAKYSNNYLILFSSSKVFSYAGQRVGTLLVSDVIFDLRFPDLLRIGDNEILGPALIQDGIYVVSAGACHTAQYGLAGMLKAANEGEASFIDRLKIYGEKAREMKKIFIDNGFNILYDKDGEEELADGFYFTITCKGMDQEELCRRLFQCGLGTISLQIMGCEGKAGVRISTSKIDPSQFRELNRRLGLFGN